MIWTESLLDEEEIVDIQNEQAEAIDRFEIIVAELIDLYEHSGMSLPDYFEGPYEERIADFLAEKSYHDEEALGSLGVRLREVDDDQEWDIEQERIFDHYQVRNTGHFGYTR